MKLTVRGLNLWYRDHSSGCWSSCILFLQKLPKYFKIDWSLLCIPHGADKHFMNCLGQWFVKVDHKEGRDQTMSTDHHDCEIGHILHPWESNVMPDNRDPVHTRNSDVDARYCCLKQDPFNKNCVLGRRASSRTWNELLSSLHSFCVPDCSESLRNWLKKPSQRPRRKLSRVW